MRARFIGPERDKLEIIEVSPGRYQFIYLNGEDRGISKPRPGPIEDLIREAIANGWQRLPDDEIEKAAENMKRRVQIWSQSLRRKLPPRPPKPPEPPKAPKRRRCLVVDADDFSEIPTP